MAIYLETEDDSPEQPAVTRTSVTGPHDEAENIWSRPTSRDGQEQKRRDTYTKPGLRVEVRSRVELIESLKRGESPTWIPNRALEALLAKDKPSDRKPLPPAEDSPTETLKEQEQKECLQETSTRLSPEIQPSEIERPRSALHTGDFHEETSSTSRPQPGTAKQACSASPHQSFLPSSPSTPWFAPAIPTFSRHSSDASASSWSLPINARSRAPSLGSSVSSSFVFRPPTSPLVHSASNTDLDFSANQNMARQSSSPGKDNRRRTLPPESFRTFLTSSNRGGGVTNYSRPFLPPRRESSFPYQAHQPRRSLTSPLAPLSMSNPQTPMVPRSRRPSYSSDHSPIQHASMVGSFEESILRGRMSTAPSKPLDFVAQIGVLGRGDCRPNLRCPAHVTVPFPAVFYNYPSTGTRSFSDDSPSPYVGTIDLEHSLKPIENRRPRKRPTSPAPSVDALMRDITAPENTHIGLAIDRKKRERQRKRSTSPRAPAGGCYRVPQQGQLQIVIKNPNKTAVKLFLIPYSLDGMEPGTKTFVRQRSFSAGPILEKPISDKPKAVIPDPLQNKSILRYLIHLKFCCPWKGRYYLYDNVRVVFANRVPDGKENLRNEVQLPEPRYSIYRPGREPSMGSAGAKLAAEKASRRCGSGTAPTGTAIDAMDGLSFTGPASSPPVSDFGRALTAAIPFHLPPRDKTPEPMSNLSGSDDLIQPNTAMEVDPIPSLQRPKITSGLQSDRPDFRDRTVSPTPGFVASTSARSSPLPWASNGSSGNGFGHYPLSRTLSPAPVEPGKGLLARELKSMNTQRFAEQPELP
jgi:Domain of unknown function (DUF4210)/Chromosome segregation during meiosis